MPTIKDIAPESVFTIELNAGTPGRQGPKGEQGIQGIQGPKGEPGPKPIRGIDYFTQQDISNMVTTITGNSNSAFNENVSAKTKEFNANVSAKTSSFDNNAMLRTEEFNANANSKKTDFNLNANNRTTEFNTNASNKKNEIDTHVTNKTTEFDNHVVEKINEFKEETSEYVTEPELESKGYLVESDLNDYAKEKDLFSGSYNDLKDKPKIPSKTSELTNDKGFINAIPSEYVTEEEQEEFIKPYNKRITENEKDIVDLETYLDNLTPKNTAKGELVHITDALPLPTFENKISGNVEQETTKGNQLIDFSKLMNFNGVSSTFENDVLTVVGTEYSTIYNSATILITKTIKNNPGKTIYLKYDKLETLVTANGTIGQLTIRYNDGTATSYNPLILPNGDIRGYAIANDTSNIEEAALGIYTSNNSPMIVNTITITKPMLTFDENAPYEKFTNGASPNPEYPQEIEVLEGYNLFDKNNANVIDGYFHGTTSNITSNPDRKIIYIPAKPNTTYTLSTPENITSSNMYAVGYTSELPAIGIEVKNKKYSSGSIKTITTGKDALYLVAFIYRDGYTLSYEEVLDGFQIVKGTDTKPYIPYGCVGYKVNGKNLWNSDFEVAEYDINGNKISSYVWVLNKIPIKVKPNTTYTISQKEHPIQYRFIYFNDDTFLSILHGTRNDNGLSDYTFTTPENCNKVYVQFRSTIELIATGTYNMATTSISEPQLELGSKTDYEPYKEQIVYLDLKGNFAGKINDDVKDYLATDKKRLYLVKNVTKIVLDNNVVLGNVLSMTNSPDYIYTYTSMFDSQIIDGSNSYQLKSMCDSLQWENGLLVGSPVTQDVFSITQGSSKVRLAIKKSRLISEDKIGVQTYLGENPITIFTTNKKTEIIDLGELPEPIKTFEGVNNIQLLANLDTEIEVKYALDVKKYYDNKLAEISAQII